MTLETILFLNLAFYLFGFIILMGLKYTVFDGIADWISILINILGIIFALNLQIAINSDWISAYNWIKVGERTINLEFLIDDQTLFMYLLVQIIAVVVQIYASKYLRKDPDYNRFFAFINLFVFSMVGLVVAGNLLQLYFFWELVGFCSYLLIGFWYQNKQFSEFAFKAFIINRIGDAFLFLGIIILYNLYGSISFEVLQTNAIPRLIPGLEFLTLSQLQTAAILFVFVGVMSKSAQFPLQIWLPDAMVGPTPASALIHAATMVVAGVFLLARLSPIISSDAGFVIALVGCATSVLGGFAAIFQYDIKKVLAYSTISQLGLMVAGIGIGAIGATLFHLSTHAFFKAGLFLCAGIVINFFGHEQDMRKMGNLTKKLPIVFWCYLIFAAGIIGIPITGGYLSKEAILSAAVNYSYINGRFSYRVIVPIFLAVSSFLTSFYIIRQFVMVFFERQDSPVTKIIGTTKKTVEGAIKTFKGLLSAENESIESEKVIGFLQNITVYEFSILILAIGSSWIFFSPSPLDFNDSWFMESFGGSSISHNWIPLSAMATFILALLISFNTTHEEIRKYYFNEKFEGFYYSVFKLGKNSFYIDKKLKRFFVKLFIGSPIAKMSSIYSGQTEISYLFKGGLAGKIKKFEKNILDQLIIKIVNLILSISKLLNKVEVNVIDFSINFLTAALNNFGNKIRKSTNGNLQLYIISMFVIGLLIVIIKIL